MKIRYNSPVILTYTIISVLVMVLGQLSNGYVTAAFFTVRGPMHLSSPLDWFRLFSYIFGHANWAHLFGNFSLILLLGPILEEKYGSRELFEMILVTALVTGSINVAFFSTGLLGASGVVFMLIVLSSMSNFREGEIPLTFVLVAFLFLGTEVADSLSNDRIAQSAHIIGGLCGAYFGFHIRRKS